MNHTARHLLAPLALGACLLMGANAQAAALDPTPLTNSAIHLYVGSNTLDYDSGSQQLSVANIADQGSFTFNSPGSDNLHVTGGSYAISATIDHTGALQSGSLSVFGAIGALGFTDENTLLLSGSITAFGYDHADDIGGYGSLSEFEFLVDDLTGALAGYYGAGLYVSMSDVFFDENAFSGSFATDFSLGEISASNLAVVPVPAAAWLLGSGLIGLVAASRRRASH